MKLLSLIFSLIAIAISVMCLPSFGFVAHEGNIIAIIGVCTTLVVGLNIYDAIMVREIDKKSERLQQKINDLESEKAFYKQKVIHYSKLANSKKVSRILLVLSILSLSVSYGVMGLFFISFLIPLIVSLALFGAFIFVRKKENKKYKEYMPMASYYASKVVSLEDEITVYTKLLSKLTK